MSTTARERMDALAVLHGWTIEVAPADAYEERHGLSDTTYRRGTEQVRVWRRLGRVQTASGPGLTIEHRSTRKRERIEEVLATVPEGAP